MGRICDWISELIAKDGVPAARRRRRRQETTARHLKRLVREAYRHVIGPRQQER